MPARPEEASLASGIVNTSYQTGSAFGLAAAAVLAAITLTGRRAVLTTTETDTTPATR